MNKRIMMTACVLACMTTGAVWAAPMQSMDPVIVTAARVSQSLKETPTPVTVVTQEMLTARGATNLAEALEAVPGITFHNDGMRRSHVTVRGTDSRHTLILVDGKRIGTDVGKTLYNPNILQDIGMENVERIEIVKGGASALYGSEAIGGVINIITKVPSKASLTWHGQTGNYQGGEHNEYRYHIGYDSGLQEQWRVKLSYGARRQVPQYNEDGGTDYYYGLARPMSVSLGYHFNEAHSLTLDYDYQTSQQYGDKYIMGMMDVNNRVVTKNTGLTFKGHDNGWDYILRAYCNQFVKDYFTAMRGKVSGMDYTKHKETMVDAQATTQLNEAHRLTIGAEYRKEDGISSRMKTGRDEGLYGTYQKMVRKPVMEQVIGPNGQPVMGQDGKPIKKPVMLPNGMPKMEPVMVPVIGPNGRPVMGQDGKPIKKPLMEDVNVHKYGADLTHRSLYVQDEWRPNDKWLIVPALRYDHSSQFGGRVLPKMGATYFIDGNHRVKLNFGTGYVTPGLMELYYDFDMAGQTHWVGNPDLKPEKSKNYEIGWEQESDRHQMKISYFYNDIKDFWNPVKVYAEKKHSKDTHYVNEYNVVSQGVEWTGQYALTDHVDLSYGYTYLKVENKDTNRPVAQQPKHKIDLGLHYQDGPWAASLWGNYYGSYRSSMDDPLENILLVNMLVSHRWDNGLRVFAGVDNLLNRDTVVRTYNGRFFKVGFDMKW